MTGAADKSIAFLFGSGVSRPSGAPTVEQLTEGVLHSAWRPHTNRKFYPVARGEGEKSGGLAAEAQGLMAVIRERITPHLQERSGRDANYEDIYSSLVQIYQDESGYIVNPLIQGFSDKVKDLSVQHWENIEPEGHEDHFSTLVERAADLVQCIVRYSLARWNDPQGLGTLTSAANALGSVDIFTLNHDILVELDLERNQIKYLDGFDERDGNVYRFSWSWERGDAKVNIFKLHGSIDWYIFPFEQEQIYQCAKYRGSLSDARDATGNWLRSPNVAPRFLTGAMVKEQDYGHGLFGDIFQEFRRRLSQPKTLFCSGYGWADNGINIRLRQWLHDDKENKIVVLHGEEGEPLEQHAFWHWRWKGLEEQGKVKRVPKWFSECSLDDLLRELD